MLSGLSSTRRGCLHHTFWSQCERFSGGFSDSCRGGDPWVHLRYFSIGILSAGCVSDAYLEAYQFCVPSGQDKRQKAWIAVFNKFWASLCHSSHSFTWRSCIFWWMLAGSTMFVDAAMAGIQRGELSHPMTVLRCATGCLSELGTLPLSKLAVFDRSSISFLVSNYTDGSMSVSYAARHMHCFQFRNRLGYQHQWRFRSSPCVRASCAPRVDGDLQVGRVGGR